MITDQLDVSPVQAMNAPDFIRKQYYDTIVNEKQLQHSSMMILKEYLDDLIKHEKITSRQIQDAKRERQAIILEMEKITHEIKKII